MNARLLLGLALGSCGWTAGRTVPSVDLSFGAGSQFRNNEQEPATLGVEADMGAVKWWHHGAGGAERHMGVGGLVVVGFRDFDRPELGADVLFAPPRADRHAGFQYRFGPRFSVDGQGLSFAAEWAHSTIGALFAQATYDFAEHDGAFLFGARINLLFPYILIKVDTYEIE